jgi:MoxR-like ATPase
MNAKILHAAWFCPSPEGFFGLPLFFWSPPGFGKTTFIKDAVSRAGLGAYERLSPGERGEGQFGVVPVPGSDGFLHYPAPDWSKKFDNGGVIFVDELNTAPPALQAPLLGLVQLRALGSYQFSRRTRVVAAANETMDAAGGWDLAPALANRFGHFDYEGLGASDWSVALLSNFSNLDDYEGPTTNAEAEEKRVMDAWAGASASANGIIAGFIKRRPELLHKQPSHAAAASSKAWPSRRSVHYAATALASARVHGLNEIDTDTFLAGFVGLPFVQELATWRANLDLPDAADVLDNRVSWKHDGRRLDRTLVVLQACAGLVAPEKAEKKKERGNKLWELIGTVLKDAADCAIPAARVLIAAKMVIPSQYPSYTDVGHKLLPILSQAGVVKG